MTKETTSLSGTAFDPSIVKQLLLELKVSDESAELLGVSPGLLEEWVRRLAVQLEDASSMEPERGDAGPTLCDKRLSAEERTFLLHDYGAIVPEHV